VMSGAVIVADMLKQQKVATTDPHINFAPIAVQEWTVIAMTVEEKLTMKTNIVDGYTLKCMCTFGRDGTPTDEYGCNELCDERNRDCNKCGIQEAFNKLADYENTGLSPAEIEELKRSDRVHTKWEICSDGYYPYCKNCHYEPPREAGMTKYCPECGARMDGDKK